METVARNGEGLDVLKEALERVLDLPRLGLADCPHGWSDAMMADAHSVEDLLPAEWNAQDWTSGRRQAMALWVILSLDEDATLVSLPENLRRHVAALRVQSAADGRDIQAELVGTRYTWIDAQERMFIEQSDGPRGEFIEDRLDRILLHPLWGSLAFLSVMGLVFSALFAWADPFIGMIEEVVGSAGGVAAVAFEQLALSMPGQGGLVSLVGDFVVNGLIGGIGSVVVFLPQIALLFLFIGLLEDCGYLARAAHLMDRVLRAAGLPGRAFVPLLSGYACAVPGIMATRTMPRFRDRLLTMMVLPLTSCSARLPVYTLMIAAIFPPTLVGLALPLRPLVLFALYLFSTMFTVAAAIVLGRILLPEVASPDVLELPPYRVPDPKAVLRMVVSRCGDFLREAGGIILWATIVLWALLTFPQYSPQDLLPADVVAQHSAQELDALAAPIALERSYAGRLGRAFEPVISPLGYDWKIGVGLIGAFAAREVFVSTMGMVYGIGGDVDEESDALRDRIRDAKRPDGTKVYTPLTGLSLLVFFALAMQCLSTIAVLKKETRGWRWPAFLFGYMTALAWGCAFVVYQGGRLLGFT
ncbi:MAG: ferrous iron transport protein B [Rhodobacterales bacterium]|nr:ferrous iron transport protein B [Rhodobacterales bacterium]